MKRRLHPFALALFFLALLYDIVVWGALPLLSGVGPLITASAKREAPLAATYIMLGSPLDGSFSSLQGFGERRLTAALGEGFPRISEDSTVAMDLIFNTTWNGDHRWIRIMYWMPPLLLVLSFILYLRRPRAIRTLGRR